VEPPTSLFTAEADTCHLHPTSLFMNKWMLRFSESDLDSMGKSLVNPLFEKSIGT
jgi:hypothetical protein